MARSPFLSPQWISDAKTIRNEFITEVEPPEQTLSANVTITQTPFGEGKVMGHVDNSIGALTIDDGHLSDADLSIEMPYSVALAMFVERDPQALMQAFLSGKIKVTGDSSKLLNMPLPTAGGPESTVAAEVAARIDAITEKPGA